MEFPADLVISPDPIPPHKGWDDGHDGAEIIFLGRVRGTEDDRPILGIDYTCYLPMAEQELRRIHLAVVQAHGPHRVTVQHRTGFVRNGEPSLLIACAARHSAEAFAICRDYLGRIKASLPVWKRVVYVAADM